MSGELIPLSARLYIDTSAGRQGSTTVVIKVPSRRFVFTFARVMVWRCGVKQGDMDEYQR